MQDNNKNILLATVLSIVILIGWTVFYEKPRIEKQEAQRQSQINNTQELASVSNAKLNITKPIQGEGQALKVVEKTVTALKDRTILLEKSTKDRVAISSDSLHGSIYLKGARFDDLTLAKYFKTAANEEEVVLFAPHKSKERYFADFGWVSSAEALDLPKTDTLWKASSDTLTPEKPLTLSWTNKQKVTFLIRISLDDNYMFEVEQSVENKSRSAISVASYGRINRVLSGFNKPNFILHEGPIGVFGDVMTEITYKNMVEERRQDFESEAGGWLGITDKYWLSSIIPDGDLKYGASFSHSTSNQNDFFNTEFVGQEFEIPAGEKLEFTHHLFAGAKKVKLLDQYAKDFDAKLFDRAVDFGWFYFLTKPFFYMISFFSGLLGNFGLAILAMTVIVKLMLFPMANKSFTAIGRVKKLQPKIEAIKARLKDDKMAMNREVMELYKKEKVNPAAGCLPIFVQIPIFFSLYKVLFVTIDMRHAPFYGWIKDLSAPDPTSVFNLFGLLPFDLSQTFTIGIWPILMGLTMMLQQKLSPSSTDPTQAKILKWMPFVLTFVLAAFPAGLVIYWTWSNTLSVLQQWVITRKLNKEDA